MLAGCVENLFLDIENERLAVVGEKLNLFFGRFVGAEQTVVFVKAASVNRLVKNIVKTANNFSSGGF